MHKRLLLLGLGSAALVLVSCATPPVEQASMELPLPPPAETLTGTYLAARFAATEGDIEGAAEFYADLLAADPGNQDLQARTFLYAATAGDFGVARPLARSVVLNDPRNRPAHLVLAAGAMLDQNYVAAEDEIAQSGGGAFSALTNTLIQAWALAGQSRHDDALAALDRLAAQTGVEGLHAFHRGLILDHAGRTDEAEAALRNAVTISGVGPRGSDALGRLLHRQGRIEEARELYEQMRAAAPGTPVAEAGLAAIAAGRVPSALVSNPAEGAAEGLFSIAAALNSDNGGEIVVLYLNLALYLRPEFDLARALLGDRYERAERYAKALAIYANVPDTSPYHSMVEIQRAINLGRLGRASEAIARMRGLTARRPENTDGWTALGDLLRGEARYEEAIPAYSGAIERIEDGRGRLAGLLYARGISYQQAGSWDDAESDFKRALEINPNRADVLNYLGYSWVDQGRNLDEAVVMLEKARSLRPLDGYIVDSVGWAYYKLGRYHEAAEVLEQAVQLAPGASELNDHLGDAYWQIGRKLHASFEWNHALNLDPPPEVRLIIERKIRFGLEAATASGS